MIDRLLRAWPLWAGAACVAYSVDATAFEARIGGSASAQFYQVSSPFGDPVLRRRRYTQIVSLDMYDLVERNLPTDARLDAKVSLRLDTDLGIGVGETDPRLVNEFVPGVQQAPLDIMFAYIEGRNFFDGVFDFRLGRQYLADVLGWWAFDGGSLRITTPIYVAFDAYAGFEQRGGARTLSTPNFEADGVFRGDRHDLDTNQWPEFLNESRLAPAFGAALQSTGLEFLDARVTYRKVINRDTVLVSPLPNADGSLSLYRDDRISTERTGASLVATEPDVGSIHSNVVYDLYTRTWNEHGAGVDWFASPSLSAGLAYDYYRPSYDADSVFNWFLHHGMTTYETHVAWRASRRLDTFGRLGLRQYATESFDDSGKEARYTSHDAFANLRATYFLPGALFGAGVSGQGGPRSHSIGADLSGSHRFVHGTYDVSWLLSLYDFGSDQRPERGATSLTYVAGGGFRPFDTVRAGLEWEHSINALVGNRLRLLATLQVSVQ